MKKFLLAFILSLAFLFQPKVYAAFDIIDSGEFLVVHHFGEKYWLMSAIDWTYEWHSLFSKNARKVFRVEYSLFGSPIDIYLVAINEYWYEMMQSYEKIIYSHPVETGSLASKFLNIILQKEAEINRRKEAEERQKRLEEEIYRKQAAERRRIAEEKERFFNNFIVAGDRAYNAKDYDRAKSYYAEGRKYDSSKVEKLCSSLIKNGDKLTDEKNYAAAVDYYRKAVVMGSTTANDKFYNSLMSAGQDNSFNGKISEAIKIYDEAINFRPSSSKAYFERGYNYAKLENYSQAIEDYTQSINLEPNYYEPYKFRGLAYEYSGNYEQAISNFSQYVKLSPDAAAPYGLRGDVYYKMQNYTQAISDYTQAIKLFPNGSDEYIKRGLAYKKLKNYKAAIKDFGNAIKAYENFRKNFEKKISH